MAKNQDKDAVLGYHEELSRHRFEAESKFDVAVVLVAGGAFTVSATLVPIPNANGLVAAAWLGASWIAWALCLLTSVGGYLLSAEGCSRRLKLLRAGSFNDLQKNTWIEKAIRPLNWFSFGALFLGFVAFGVFTLSNLHHGGTNGEGKKEGQEESVIQETPRRESRNKHPGPSTGISEGKEEGKNEVTPDERQTTPSVPTTATEANTPPGRDREARQNADVGLTEATGQGDQRTRNTTGVPQNPQAIERP